MAPRPRGIPSFFKIMLDCSATHLPLPTGFVRKHLENDIPENATLRSVNGGYSWRLKIKKDGDIYCFADGWKQRFPLEFARLIRLTAGRTMSMKNLQGKEWPVRLLSEGGHYTRYYLSKGWSEFLRDNDICEGDTCVFKYLRSEDKFCLAEIIKKRAQADGAMAVESLKRPRGRPVRVVVEQPTGKVLKRPRGRPPCVEVAVEKRARPTEPDEGLKRKRGQPRRVESKDGGVEVVKRPRGRPFKKKIEAQVDIKS
ncbi:unnamed protein product [Lactuca saligna]|uniref:TF-B3 domain-containing protein n=1 Tax=Lactuca saligna TaxID=75948 RepID=A0AA36E136_LACSI|nr:unnamed protein product [Lactuca saligna]